ncbi:Long-chain-fatty-acid--CoA ligase 5 [Lamellibrachia satsuma]|nr:Long-chain-fatty-acid--CoA ligase 5 [Lamellibrachia satsuma]
MYATNGGATARSLDNRGSPTATPTATVTATPLRGRPTMDYPHFAVHRAYGSKRDPPVSESMKNPMTGLRSGGAAVPTAGVPFCWTVGAKPYRTPIDILNQSQKVPGMPSARMSWYCKDGKLIDYLDEDVRTFYDSFKRGARFSDNGKCLGWKPSKSMPFKWMTYNQVLERAENIGSGFIHKGIQPVNTSRIGLFCRNTPEYVITDLACATYSMVLVPLYDTLGPDTCTFIINQADINLVLCDTRDRVMKLLKNKSQTPNLKTVVCFHCMSSAVKQMTADADLDVITFEQLEKLGREYHTEPKPCVPSDLCTICYTSGTTGNPKGAMITHQNLIAAVSGCELHLGRLDISPKDVYLSYLPLPHIYEKVNQAFLYSHGCQVGFFQGDMLLFKDDMLELRPTVFATVPRLLNRIYGKLKSEVSKSYIGVHFCQVPKNTFDITMGANCIKTNAQKEADKFCATELPKVHIKDPKWKRVLYQKDEQVKRLDYTGAVTAATPNYRHRQSGVNEVAQASKRQRGIIRKNSIWDMLIFRKVQNSLGGQIRAVICGSAPLSPHVINFTRVVFGCVVMEAYGLTETTAVVVGQIPGDYEAGTVGPPFPANIVKLIDIPEMNYYVENQQGEVCVKGANVFVGYLDEPEKMAETVDSDGWLHTGDVGMWLPNGALKIIDRKKNIIKLAQGEYVAPEKIENIYMSSEVVGQVLVHGNSLKASVVAIVVADPDEVCGWVKRKLDVEGASVAELCARPDVKQAIHEDMLAVGKKAGLMSFEQVKDIYITTEMFSIDNAQLTPTQKIKRYNILDYYTQEIKEMYSHLQ